MTGEQDPYFPPAAAAAEAAKLRALGAPVRESTFPGAHEWSEAASHTAAAFTHELAERAAG
jgi:predicted esterase